MKHGGKLLACLTTGLVLSTSARAADLQGNPYQSIVERNVFALKAPPPPPDPDSQKPPPPPITLQGISSMFGRKQVLFKALMPGNKPGEAPKDTAMVLSVNEHQGEIEILEIDERNATVKFNNHGTEQTLLLTNQNPHLPPVTLAASFPGIGAPANARGMGVDAAFNPIPTTASTAARDSPPQDLAAVPAATPQPTRPRYSSQAHHTLQREYERALLRTQQRSAPSSASQ